MSEIRAGIGTGRTSRVLWRLGDEPSVLNCRDRRS
jgi:hypothetical protein